MVLVATSSRIRYFGNINVSACASRQALPIRLLCTLPLRANQHLNLLGNCSSLLLARQKENRKENLKFSSQSRNATPEGLTT